MKRAGGLVCSSVKVTQFFQFSPCLSLSPQANFLYSRTDPGCPERAGVLDLKSVLRSLHTLPHLVSPLFNYLDVLITEFSVLKRRGLSPSRAASRIPHFIKLRRHRISCFLLITHY